MENTTYSNKDKGIKKALSKQRMLYLPSNFSHKMMIKINEEVERKKKRQERNTLTLITATSIVMISGCIAFIIRYTDVELTDATEVIAYLSNILFYIPMIISLPLLGLFNHWLRKKYRHLLND